MWNHQMVNFDIMHDQCRGDILQKSINLCKAVSSKDFRNYNQPEMKGTIKCVQRTDRKDLFLEKEPCY